MSASGAQWIIGYGHQRATITEVGATLRAYSIAERDIIDGFGPREWSPSGRGQVLVPWPNRLGDGHFEFSGLVGSAPWDEPQRRNAIHGLVRWLPWTVVAHAQNAVILSLRLHPTPAFPFALELRIEYRLGRAGLAVTLTADNPGELALPFGAGFHPYVSVGTERIDTALLTVPASRYLVMDDRALPTGEAPEVAGTARDFTLARPIGSTQLDDCFSGLERDTEGRATVMLEHPDGQSLDVWMDHQFNYVMVYTGDTIGEISRRRRAIAIEPMTCPPDALRTGTDIVVIAPEQRFQASWGLTFHD